MPRMSKKRRLEWSFFLRQVKVGNTTCDRITYNDLCRGCTHSCKQSFLKLAHADAAGLGDRHVFQMAFADFFHKSVQHRACARGNAAGRHADDHPYRILLIGAHGHLLPGLFADSLQFFKRFHSGITSFSLSAGLPAAIRLRQMPSGRMAADCSRM